MKLIMNLLSPFLEAVHAAAAGLLLGVAIATAFAPTVLGITIYGGAATVITLVTAALYTATYIYFNGEDNEEATAIA